MSVEILLVTHGEIGQALVSEAAIILGRSLHEIHLVGIEQDGAQLKSLAPLIAELNQGDGVLVLSDLVGATPCNCVSEDSGDGICRVVSGLNLPMLLRVLNYADQPLAELAETAVSGGRRGVQDLAAAS